jgi:hypothetical protein
MNMTVAAHWTPAEYRTRTIDPYQRRNAHQQFLSLAASPTASFT